MTLFKSEVHTLLSNIYYSQPHGQFSGAETLFKIAHKVNDSVTRSDVKKFLRNSYTYLRNTLSVPRHKKIYSRYIQLSAWYEVFIDLFFVDFGKYKTVVIAVSPVSGFTGVERIFRKTPSLTAQGLLKIRKRFPKPFERCISDRGTEFSRIFQSTILPVKHKYASGRQKAFYAEHQIGRIRQILGALNTERGSNVKGDLQLACTIINQTPSAITDISPADFKFTDVPLLASRKGYGDYLWRQLTDVSEQPPKFDKGEHVR